MESTEKKLRENILNELKKLTRENSPCLYEMIQTEKGYKQLEKSIIERVIRDNMLPIAIIPQIESDLSLAQVAENE